MELQHINIENLKPSTVNVRKKGAKSVDDILPSIRSLGIIQPLLVRKTRGAEGECPTGRQKSEGYEIVAGQRRYHAVSKLQDEGITEPLPCIVMQDGDDAKAIEASLAENVARLPMDEIDQYKAFVSLQKQGSEIADIAAQFGVTELLVKKRLAIANIINPILTLYRKEQINAHTLRALTLASKSQQKKWLDLYRSDDEYAPQGYGLKEWLLGGREIPVENALFEVKDYKGSIITDLFEETRLFDDSEAFWELQNKAIASIRDEYLAKGWKDVIIMDVGSFFYDWEFAKASKKDGGSIHVEIKWNGEVIFHEGYITKTEAKKRKKALEADSAGEAEASIRPELTKAMQNYLELHRHASIRNKVADNQGIALRLCVAQIVAGSSLWNVSADPQRADKPEITKSLRTNKADIAFGKKRDAIRNILGLENSNDDTVTYGYDERYSVHALFKTLLGLTDKQAMKVLSFLVAESLPCGTDIVEALGVHLEADLSEDWSVDECFFNLLRDKEAINAMLNEVGGKATADAHVTSTAKVQKKIISDYLDGTRRGSKENWHPRYINFPMQSYTKRGGIEAIDRYKSIKKHYA